MGDKETTLRSAAQNLLGKSYVRGPLRITVTQAPEIDEHGRLVVWVSATRDGVPLDLDLPFVYVNPPLNVVDGHRTETDPRGRAAQVPILRESPLDALKQIVADTVDRF